MAKKKQSRKAPYVSAAALSSFLDHIRYVSTPKKVDAGLLQDYGISKGNTFSLLSALKFLGLTDNAGIPTPAFASVQTMGEEFRSNLQEIVQKAYADLFSRLDVSRDSRDHIWNYFSRNYSTSQADKATILFLDLCKEAGIPVAEEKRARETREARPKGQIMKGKRQEISEKSTAEEGEKTPSAQLDIRIDSKDFASMQADQIQSFFNGLSKIIKREEKPEQ